MRPAAARHRALGAAQIAWADAASWAQLVFYRRLVLRSGHIKPAEQSSPTTVSRGACEITSLLSLTRN